MKYFYIENLRSDEILTSSDISKLPHNIPTFKNKQLYREWCSENTTQHVFYSAVEGCSPKERVTVRNPPRAVHGVVADYDAKVDWPTIEDKLTNLSNPPTWMSKTYSGYLRLVWEFETPCPITEDIYPAFISEMSKVLNLAKVAAGFDKTSLKASQYFELGTEWKKLGTDLPKSMTQTALIKSASSTVPSNADTDIPIGVIGEEVEKQFPNRWKNPFEVGQRGPLFWIDDGIERDGCQITDHGIVCYSDRAGKGFLTWREILGSDFVKDYEEKKMGHLLDEYWYNGRSHFKILYGQAVPINEQQLVRELKQAGFGHRKQKGKTTSEIEDALLVINNVNRVNDIAPVIFSKDRIVEYNSNRILNTGKINPIVADSDGDPSKWPFLQEWLNQLFENTGQRPTVEYFYAWMKRFYTAVITPTLTHGQALLLVGPTNKGKSLLSNRVISALVGGFSDASEYVSGLSHFNKDLARVAAWVVDDTTSAASFQDQLKATELIKRAVANPRMEYMAKYADAMSLPWTGRVIMSLNMDANSLSVIPALDSSNRDKIMALLIREDATSNFPANHVLESIIEDELPHFAKWLLDWDPPQEIVSGPARFGVVSYIDERIADAAYDNSSRSSVAELVDFFARKAREYSDSDQWHGTLTDFLTTILDFNDGRHVGRSSNQEFVRRGMSMLEEAAKQNPLVRPVASLGHGGGKIWVINIESKYDIMNSVQVPTLATSSSEPF